MADKIIYIDNLAGQLIPTLAKDNGDSTYSLASYLTDNLSSVNNTTLWQKMSRNGQGFTAVTGFVTVSGTAEFDFMLIRNPGLSGNLVRLKEFFLTVGGAVTNTSIFRFYRAPTITNTGAAITINKVLSSSSTASTTLAYQSPTISNRGGLIQLFSVDFKTLDRDQELSRYLVEGADILVTVQGSVTNIEHNVVFVWGEEPL